MDAYEAELARRQSDPHEIELARRGVKAPPADPLEAELARRGLRPWEANDPVVRSAGAPTEWS